MLQRCIEGIHTISTYHNFEVVVVDNGSSDENRKKIQAFLTKYNVQYAYRPMDFNFSAMCNIGARLTDGDYILFVLDNSTTNTVIRIDKTIDEGVDGARITVERFTTPWEYIRMGFNWIQLNAVTLNNGKVTFEGLESNPFSSYGTPTSRAYNAENEAFEFGLEYNNGEDYTYIAITYGEWYEVISDTSCTFTDFANLVNNKLVEAECPFDVRYDDSEKCFIVTSSVWDSFSVLNIYSHGWFGDWDEVTFPPTEEEEDPNEPHL